MFHLKKLYFVIRLYNLIQVRCSDLLENYDKNIRPYYLIKPVEISIDIFMNAFGSVIEFEKSFFVLGLA